MRSQVKALVAATDCPPSVARQYLAQLGHDVAKATETMNKDIGDAAAQLTAELGKAPVDRDAKIAEQAIDFLTQVNRARLVLKAYTGSET
jgi:hypothetical protein